ncbi:MAG: PCRF domain-containing protein, partial [Candidatus Saccharimonadaceae bacterium]
MTNISLNLNDLGIEKSELTDFLSRPDAFADPDYAKKNRRLVELDELIATGNRQAELRDQIRQAYELSDKGDELAELAKLELPELETELAELNEKLFTLLTPKDP